MAGNHDPMSPQALFGHVQDADYFHVPRSLAPETHGHISLPQPLIKEEPLWTAHTGVPLIDQAMEPLEMRFTKFMLLEVVVAVGCIVLFSLIALRMRGGGAPKGKLWNMFEAMLLFIRDEVARPAIGKHDADRFLPFLWTMFFFVLGCNLLGMVPWMGSATGALATTGALALCTFGVVLGSGMAKLGVVGFWKAQVPHMDLPIVLAIPLIPMIFAIEILGMLIKHFVLAVRLLANMMAGHVVLSVLLAFIAVAGMAVESYAHPMFLGISAASVLGAVALSLLELFVAFLQAYIFTFLSALFIGMAVHPH
ncbi:MAG: F0F1 ATP synthase subunit A [Planctomycetales bacterium]|nr:F0F1 ATP synthase subunit A [Planctomycetales bacterium]